jgi:large subunit ribosomal protein L7/L12
MSDEATETIELSKEEKAVITALEKLNIIQVNNVVKFMEQEYGISAAPVAVAAAGGAAAGGAAEAEEKTAFNVVLTAPGGQKIAVIKAVREITGLSLKEAKGLVDTNGTVLENADKAKADEAKATLEAAGASVELS